ncbi:hypothetical protein Igag_0135 [Ignisphaera aggregans DSM 17230]|uniref:Uncharacterized protein n=1 Tax=Ignisphaera aggregans (strain DSM 17230 / JCM 13409 / AQ1.S1) TaxID=583356 RepID=E0SPW4_IGNAA|nr:hypothetical protein Igag_0135 [Ignisphaera aggregans DSM 17230]
MRSLNKRISTLIRIIPMVNSLLLIYLFTLLPLNFRLIDVLEYGIGINVMEFFRNIQSLSTILIISVAMFIISCIESLRLLLINRIHTFIIEYVLIFLFFQELLFTFLYIVMSIISLKFIRFFINPSFNRKNLNEKIEDTYIDTGVFIGFLMISIGSILVVNLLLSFIMEVNIIAILSYMLIAVTVLVIKRENIYRSMIIGCAYSMMAAIPPFGILTLLHN